VRYTQVNTHLSTHCNCPIPDQICELLSAGSRLCRHVCMLILTQNHLVATITTGFLAITAIKVSSGMMVCELWWPFQSLGLRREAWAPNHQLLLRLGYACLLCHHDQLPQMTFNF
jgi:hypothetical protein